MESPTTSMVRRHWRLGWWSLALFLTLGAVLESMHGFKVSWYLARSSEARRLALRLAHAHGTLLAVLNLVFCFGLHLAPKLHRTMHWCSRLLQTATLLIPSGFLIGGLWIQGGDPGPGILLVPFGALCLIVCALIASLHLPPPGSASSTSASASARSDARSPPKP